MRHDTLIPCAGRDGRGCRNAIDRELLRLCARCRREGRRARRRDVAAEVHRGGGPGA